MNPLVSICCITYNHVQYIKEALDGFLCQKTNFDFEIVIHDDASTDGTREIIEEYVKKYPLIFKPLYQNENQWSKGVRGIFVNYTFSRARGKYIAMCEGDDYWTDPYKLQKQVDFLETNPDYSICWTKYKTLKESKKNPVIEEPDWIVSIDSSKSFHIDLNNIFTPYCTMTLTCLFKRENFDISVFKKMRHAKDNTLYALCLSKGNGMLLNFYGAVYRLHEGGIYSSNSTFNQKYFSYLNIKEIINFLPECNNKNFITIRNYLLVDSIIFLSRKKMFKYYDLLIDSFQYFGFKKTIYLFLKKIKGATLTRKAIS